MSYNLYLDDFRHPKDSFSYTGLPIYNKLDWIIVRNYFAFVTLIEKKGVPNIISFDHDLVDAHYKKQIFDYNDDKAEKTGYHCAMWLIQYCIDNNLPIPNDIYIHSMNPYGSLNIKSLFDTYYKAFKITPTDVYILPSTSRGMRR